MNIKEIRLQKGLSQSDAASALGISSVVYSRYETGARQPSIDMLIHMADVFDVSIDYLLGRKYLEEQALSDYELQLLIAARNADKRAREDALNMLLAHTTSTAVDSE